MLAIHQQPATVPVPPGPALLPPAQAFLKDPAVMQGFSLGSGRPPTLAPCRRDRAIPPVYGYA